MVFVMASYVKTGKTLDWNRKEVKKGNKYSVADSIGHLICPMWFLEIRSYIDGLATVKYKKNIFSKVQWGVVDTHGCVTLFSGDYENMIVLNHNLIAVQEKGQKGQKGRWGLVDKNGIVICKPQYDECPVCIIGNQFYTVSINGMHMLIDATGH